MSSRRHSKAEEEKRKREQEQGARRRQTNQSGTGKNSSVAAITQTVKQKQAQVNAQQAKNRKSTDTKVNSGKQTTTTKKAQTSTQSNANRKSTDTRANSGKQTTTSLAKQAAENAIRRVEAATGQKATKEAKASTLQAAKQAAEAASARVKAQKSGASTLKTAKSTAQKVADRLAASKPQAPSLEVEQRMQRVLAQGRLQDDLNARLAQRQSNILGGREVLGGTGAAKELLGTETFRPQWSPFAPDSMSYPTKSGLDRLASDVALRSKGFGLGKEKVSAADILAAASLDPLSALKADSKSYANYGRGVGMKSKQPELGKTDKEKVQTATERVKEWNRKAARNRSAAEQVLSRHDNKLREQFQQEIRLAKADYDAAKARGDTTGMQEAHKRAETWRRIEGGYSGGVAGNEYLTPKLEQSDVSALNKTGQRQLRAAKLGYENAQTEQERNRYAAMGQDIRRNPAYLKEQYDRGAYRETDANGRMRYAGTAEERAKEAAQAAAIPKAIGTGIAGSFLSLPGTTARALQADAARNQSRLQALSDIRGGGQVSISEPERLRTGQEILAELRNSERYQNANAISRTHKLARAMQEIKNEVPLGQRLLNRSDIYREKATEGQTGLNRYLTEALITGGEMVPGLAATALTGGAAAPGLAVMGAQAAGRRMGDLERQGEDPVRAFNRGLVTGLIEAATERVPLGNLTRIARGGGKSFGRNLLTQALTEMGTEELSEVGNYAADKAFRDPNASLTAKDLRDTAVISLLTSLGMGAGAGIVGSRRTGGRTEPADTTDTMENLDAREQTVKNQIETWKLQTSRNLERLRSAGGDQSYRNHLLSELSRQQEEGRALREQLEGIQSMKERQASGQRRAEAEQLAPETAREAGETLASEWQRGQSRRMQERQDALGRDWDRSIEALRPGQRTRTEPAGREVPSPLSPRVSARTTAPAAEQAAEARRTSPQYGQPENHIDHRGESYLGDRKTKAFQWDHPEVKPYFQQAAEVLKRDAEYADASRTMVRASKAQRNRNRGSGRVIHGTVMEKSDAVKGLMRQGMSTTDIIKACDAILNDQGQENYAAAKRVELALDTMLSNGYLPAEAGRDEGARVGPNEGYLRVKESLPGAVRRGPFEDYLRHNELALDAGEVTEDELRQEWEADRQRRQEREALYRSAEDWGQTPRRYRSMEEELAAHAQRVSDWMDEPEMQDAPEEYWQRYWQQARVEEQRIREKWAGRETAPRLREYVDPETGELVREERTPAAADLTEPDRGQIVQNRLQKVTRRISELSRQNTFASPEEYRQVKQELNELLDERKRLTSEMGGLAFRREVDTQGDRFRQWFKNSRVTQPDGTPKIMYHGTSKYGFDQFDPYSSSFGLFGYGSYFTEDPSVAESYTQKGKGQKPGVYSAYLSIRNPIDMDAPANMEEWIRAFREVDDLDVSYLRELEGQPTNEDCFRALKNNLADLGYHRYDGEEAASDFLQHNLGYDGITHIGGGRFNKNDQTRHRVYIAFNDDQIQVVSGRPFAEAAPAETVREEGQKNTPQEAEEVVTQQKPAEQAERPHHPKGTDFDDLVVQLRDNLQDLVNMEPVSVVTGKEVPTEGRATERALSFLRKIGMSVFRPGFGEVLFSKSKIKSSFVGHGVGNTKVELIAGVPDVIAKGDQIGFEPNWKGRGYDSYVFAGPVMYKGAPVYIGAIVNKYGQGNRYYLHEVVDQDGNIIYGEEKEPEGIFRQESPEGLNTVIPSDSDNSIPQTEAERNGKFDEEAENVSDQDPYSVGAAPSGFDEYSHMQNEYGTIEPGENPARMVDVPVSTNGEDRVRRGVRTIMEAQITPDEAIQAFEDEVVKGTFSYQPRKDKASVETATKTLEDKGYWGAMQQWQDVTEGRRAAGKDDIVLAQFLYAEAARAKDIDTMRKLAAEIAAEATVAGQQVQAMRLLKKATPEGKVYYIHRLVSKMQAELEEGRRDKAPTLTIDPALEERLLDAEDEESQQEVIDEIYDQVAEQLPKTFADRLNAWRYFAMLGNPRTHIRNVVGNILVQVPLQVSNKASALAQAATQPKEKRTRAVIASRAAKQFARADYQQMKNVLSDGDKYASDESQIRRRQKLFPTPVQALMDANSKALEAEDMIFKRGTYIQDMASFLTAKGWDVENLTESQLEQARSHAIKEAKHATFQDASAFATWLARQERKNKVTKVAIGGLMPFKGVPVNIAKMGFELSPAGLAKALTYDAKQVRKGEMDATDMIDHLTRGMTGTAIAGLGYFLAAQGMLTAGAGDDEKENDFEMAQGGQNYALDLGDITYTLDWAAPSAIPLFLGAEYWNARNRMGETGEEEDEAEDGQAFKEGLEALTRLFDPMLNMTVLSGVSDTLKTVSYSRVNALFPMAWSIGQNYAGQVVPTLLGQIARTVDDTRRTTYADRDSKVPNGVQKFIQRQENKIPGLSQRNLPWLDVWGREDREENPAIRALENFISPGYISRKNTSEMEAELARLNDLGFEGVLPSKAKTSAKVNDKYLTRDQYETLVKTQGGEARSMLEQVIGSPGYNALSDEEKAAYVKKIFDFSRQEGKLAVGMPEDQADKYVLKAREGQKTLGLDPATYLAMYVTKSLIDKDEEEDKTMKAIDFSLAVDAREDLNEEQKAFLKDNIKFFNMFPVSTAGFEKGLAAGLTAEESKDMLRLKKQADTDGNGSYTNAELYDVIQSTGKSEEEKAKLWDAMKPANSNKSWNDLDKENKAAEAERKKWAANVGDVSQETIDSFQESVNAIGGYSSMSYTAFFDLMDSMGVPEKQRAGYYAIVQANKAHPWKKSYAQAKKYKGR